MQASQGEGYVSLMFPAWRTRRTLVTWTKRRSYKLRVLLGIQKLGSDRSQTLSKPASVTHFPQQGGNPLVPFPKVAGFTFSQLWPLGGSACYRNPWYFFSIIQCTTHIGPRLGLPKFEFGLRQKSQELGNTSQAGSGKLKERCQKYLGWGYCRNINHLHRLLDAFGLQVRLVSLKEIIHSSYYSAPYCIMINYTVIGLSPSYNKLYHSV